jgi:hypothetical protein
MAKDMTYYKIRIGEKHELCSDPATAGEEIRKLLKRCPRGTEITVTVEQMPPDEWAKLADFDGWR